MAPRALLNLLNRHAIEGAWDAQQGEINEAIFKAMEFDHEKTRILIRMPNVRQHVDKKLADYPLGIRAIRTGYVEQFKLLRAELEALKAEGAKAEKAIEDKQREFDACEAQQQEKLQVYNDDFKQDLKLYLTRTLEKKRADDAQMEKNTRIYKARGWRDEIAPELAMYRAGEDVELEGRGARATHGATISGQHTAALVDSKSRAKVASRAS